MLNKQYYHDTWQHENVLVKFRRVREWMEFSEVDEALNSCQVDALLEVERVATVNHHLLLFVKKQTNEIRVGHLKQQQERLINRNW